MAGAYQPDTSISSAILPMLAPKSWARPVFQVAAMTTPAGKPMDALPVKLLLMEAGPSQSTCWVLPTDSTATLW